LTRMQRLQLLGAALMLSACAGNAVQSAPGSPGPSTQGRTAAPTPAVSSLQSPTPSAATGPSATPNPFLVPGHIGTLVAAAGLPTAVAGHVLHFSAPYSIPDYWLTTGIAEALGLRKSDVYLMVEAYDGPDSLNALGTLSVTAIGYRGAQPAALLDAFVTEAKRSPQSLCPKCAFTHATIAGKRIVIEAGMPPRRQPNGKPAFPGQRQYAYAHGDILYGFVAANAVVVAEVLGALP
jgi:hypothetical protein